MKSLLCILAFVFITGTSSGQDYTFRVVSNQGQNKVRATNGDLLSMKIGTRLHNYDVIITADDAIVRLYHESGKILHLKGHFEHRVEDLGLKVEWENGRNVVMTNPSYVEVAGDDVPLLTVFLPAKSADACGDQVIVRWQPLETATEETAYTVTLVNIFDDVIHREETKATFFTLDFDEIKEESQLYIFRVEELGRSGARSFDFGIKKLSVTDRPAVAKGLKSLLSKTGENAPLDNLKIADFYEENGLLLDAITQYEKALQSAPELQTTRKRYNDFLTRHRLAVFEE